MYVPEEAVETYKTTDGWSEFTNILPISGQAETTEIEEAQALPTDTSVVIEWPFVENAIVYTIEIKKDGELVCSIIFDENGQLKNVVFAAPARRGNSNKAKAAQHTANGWKYTVEGLETNVDYTCYTNKPFHSKRRIHLPPSTRSPMTNGK